MSKEWFEGKSVALIGNAQSLFDKSYGDEIDKHDCVVRMNKGAIIFTKTEAFHTHGKKTTHWFFFNAGEYRPHFGNIPKDVKKAHMSKYRQTPVHRKIVDFMMSKGDHETISDLLGQSNPTTGLMSLYWIAKCNPKLIDVYGFDWKATPTFTDPERKKDPSCDHDFVKEKALCFKRFFSQSHITWRD